MGRDVSERDRRTEYLTLARELIERLESGDETAADETIDRLTRLRETELFRELGVLTRSLHEALKSFKVDTRLSDIAANEIPDARQRLNHVIDMTEQAADRTLTAIESALPLAEEVGTHGHQLGERWRRFRARDMGVEEFRDLSRDLEAFLALAERHGSALQSSLSDALMAQDYQDLTGQIIRRVINLVQELEDSLVDLVRISGARMAEEKPVAADNPDESGTRGFGPAVPGQDEDVVSGQDEVDDLLSSLGF